MRNQYVVNSFDFPLKIGIKQKLHQNKNDRSLIRESVTYPGFQFVGWGQISHIEFQYYPKP